MPGRARLPPLRLGESVRRRQAPWPPVTRARGHGHSRLLPDDVDLPQPPEGYTDESWFQNYDSYVNDVNATLEAQAPGSFFPTINSLDSLARSINVR